MTKHHIPGRKTSRIVRFREGISPSLIEELTGLWSLDWQPASGKMSPGKASNKKMRLWK